MALTKVTGHVIKTDTNVHTHNLKSTGIITAIGFDGPILGIGNSNIRAGILTAIGLDINGNADISGDLTIVGSLNYTNVTDIYSVGVATFAKNVQVGAGISVVGVSTFNDAIGIGDSIIHLDNTDTSIRFPSDDTFTVETAGSERLRITSDGDVGIGTNSPYENASYNGLSVGGLKKGLIELNDDSDVARAHLYTDGGDFKTSTVGTAGTIRFITGGTPTERLSIDSNGDINLGDNPTNQYGYKLNIQDSAILYAQTASSGGTELKLYLDHSNTIANFGTVSTSHLAFVTTNKENVRITSNGRLGIGTTAPLGVAHINVGGGTTEPFVLERVGNGDQSSIWSMKPYGGNLYFRGGPVAANYDSDRFAILYGNNDAYGGDVAFYGTAAGITSCLWDASANTLIFNDDVKAAFGNGSDFTLWHNNSHGLIKNTTGRLYVLSDDVWFKNEADNKTSARFFEGNEVYLYNNDTVRLTTTSTGITVGGEVAATQDYPNYRPTLDFNFIAVKKLDPRVTFTRDGTATYIDEQGGFKWASSNQPRFDHDDTTHESRGLLIEKARTNVWGSDSNNIDSGSNSGGSPGPTLVSNTVEAPDGSSTATTVNWTTARSSNLNSANTEYTGWDSDPSGKTYSASIWVKGTAGETVNFYFDASGQGSSDTGKGNFTLTGKWQRLSVYHTFPAGSNAAYVRSGARSLHSLAVGTANIVSYWGLTIVEESSPGSSIVTPIMSQTTAADKFSIEGEEFTDFYNQTEGTIFLSASYNDNARSAAIVTIDDTSNESEYTEVGYRSGGASAGAVASYIRTDAGNDQYYKQYTSSATIGNEFKVALAYKDDDYASSVSGQTVDTDTSGTTSKVYDRLRLSAVDTVTYSGSGHYRRLMYYQKRLPDNQVVTLTS